MIYKAPALAELGLLLFYKSRTVPDDILWGVREMLTSRYIGTLSFTISSRQDSDLEAILSEIAESLSYKVRTERRKSRLPAFCRRGPLRTSDDLETCARNRAVDAFNHAFKKNRKGIGVGLTLGENRNPSGIYDRRQKKKGKKKERYTDASPQCYCIAMASQEFIVPIVLFVGLDMWHGRENLKVGLRTLLEHITNRRDGRVLAESLGIEASAVS